MGSISRVDSDARTRIRQQEVLADLRQQALESDDLDQRMHDAAGVVDDLRTDEAESTPDEGTTVRFTLPVVEGQADE